MEALRLTEQSPNVLVDERARDMIDVSTPARVVLDGVCEYMYLISRWGLQ